MKDKELLTLFIKNYNHQRQSRSTKKNMDRLTRNRMKGKWNGLQHIYLADDDNDESRE
jgi:hypothetical protein